MACWPACLPAGAQPGSLFVFAVILGFFEADIKHTKVDLGKAKAVLAARDAYDITTAVAVPSEALSVEIV